MSLVMKTKRAHRGMSLSQAMKMAKKHYKKGGGEDMVAGRHKTRRGGGELNPLPLGVGGRRKTRKFRLF